MPGRPRLQESAQLPPAQPPPPRPMPRAQRESLPPAPAWEGHGPCAPLGTHV